MKKALLATVAAAALGFGGAAYASPVYLDNGVHFGVDNSTKTGVFDTLGIVSTLATSIYVGTPIGATQNTNPAGVGYSTAVPNGTLIFAPGTQVIDTNDSTTMNTYGFVPGGKTNLFGTDNAFNATYPVVPQGVNIDTLNTPSTGNGFSNGTGDDAWGAATGRWGLTYTYTLSGVTTATGVNFTGGTIDIFYNGVTTASSDLQSIKVLEIDVTGSNLQAPNLTVFGKVDKNFLSGASAFVQNFWNLAQGGGTSFLSYLNGGSDIDFRMAINVDPAMATLFDSWNATWVTNDDRTPVVFRQSVTSGIAEFNVPEPATLALMGLALAGAGVVSRRRKQA